MITYIGLRAVAVGGKNMPPNDSELDAIKQGISEAADFLLPIAVATSWPCRLELVAWLTALRDSYQAKKPLDLH